ncbi:hypothetical protein [Blastopirellula retiformator]|uniref:Uncharacterized protein n=1 Tax=Blastopirellula retiformator TaxID=2527970 RepID=A0A5C5VNY4_9BACT|nr:hypothetical protein [Blastopirellula retiformator]TWT39342.1 hypothetical protein Enr8_10410 [Blastopirellula retiformator]
MKYFSCGADVSPQSSQCEYCGSYVEPTPPPTMTKRIDDWRKRIFAAIKDSPQFQGTAQSRFRKRLAAKFATVELEDGRRQELSVWDPSLYQRLAHDQAGVLFRRGQVATNFQCVPVSRSLRGSLQLT